MRPLNIYKTKLLNNVILVSEVAELSAAVGDSPHTDTRSRRSDTTPTRGHGHVHWSSLRFGDDKKSKIALQDVTGGLSNEVSEDSGDGDSVGTEIMDAQKKEKTKRKTKRDTNPVKSAS